MQKMLLSLQTEERFILSQCLVKVFSEPQTTLCSKLCQVSNSISCQTSHIH